MSVLKVNDLCKEYQDGDDVRVILNNINYSFEKGNVYTIVGESGSGKTTFLSIIAGLDTPTSGSVYYHGKDIMKMGLTNYRNDNMSIVFQSYNLINYLTAIENVIIAMDIDNHSGKARNKDNTKEYAKELLVKVGITGSKQTRVVNKLSGGEQQRVAIARALATSPDLILADEPTGNLDSKTGNEIVKILKDLAKKEDKCVIIVTHSKDVEKAADVKIKLEDGKLKTK